MSLPMAGRLELDGPFQPKQFYDSIILSFYDLSNYLVLEKIETFQEPGSIEDGNLN